MTKTKVDVQSSPSQVSASPKERRLLLRHKMENGGGTGSSDNGQMQHAMAEQQQQHPDSTSGAAAVLSGKSAGENKKKKINRAPSPARPKDVPGWSLTKIRGGIATPTLSVKPGAIHLGSRVSRRGPAGSPGGKESKPEKHGAGRQTGRAPASSQAKSPGSKTGKSAQRRKTSDASTGSDDLSKDSGCAAEKLSPTDSSSELSDCASEGNKLSTDAASSDTESRSSRGGGVDGEKPVRDGGVFFSDVSSRQQAARNAMEKERLSMETGDESMSPGDERSATSFDSRVPASTSLAFSDLTEELVDGMQEEFVREIEELRSENDYLKGPVGGENDHLETRDKRGQQADSSGAVTSLPACLRFKDHDALLAMREQARLVSMAIQLLTIPTEANCLSPSSLYHMVCQEEPAGSCDHPDKPQNQMSELSDLAERPLVAALTSRLQALHSQLQAFVERVDSLGGSPVGDRDPQVEGASPQTLMPEGRGLSLGASPSLLPLGPAVSQDKKPDSSDQPECKVNGQEEEASQSEPPECNQKKNHTESPKEEADVTPAGQTHPGGVVYGTGPAGPQGPAEEGALEEGPQSVTAQALQLKQLREDHQKALTRRDFQLQSVGLQARLQTKLWRRERTLLLQESQHLKQSLLLTSVKLRCFLKHWRLGHKTAADGGDILEVNSLKELYLLLEEEKHLTSPAHFQAAAEEQPRSPTIKWGGVCSTLADLRGALQGLSGELRLERQGSQELTQQFARAKASWEVERNELKSIITQLDNKTGKASAALSSSTEALDAPDLKGALKREREEHQLLLAESYAAVMDLTKQLQIGERNWSREKMELVETLGQERAQWEQRGGEFKLQTKSKAEGSCDEAGPTDSAPDGPGPLRAKSMSELQNPETNGLATQEERSLSKAPPSFLFRSEFGDITGRNWSYLTNETPEVADGCKTWDGPAGPEAQLDPESARKSFTAPDRTGIRIYYSPPAARRMEHLARHQAGGTGPRSGPLGSRSGPLGSAPVLDQKQPSSSSSSSSYEQWLSSLSTPRGALLVSPSAVNANGAAADGAMDSPSPSPSASSSSSSSSFRGLDMGDISVNLSDDMKEMTNCVRQAIRSSSLERKSPKEAGSQMAAGMATRSTQTATQCASVGLQTDGVGSAPRVPQGLHSKAWSPRHSPATAVSSLASARTRQISTSLDKVHGRVDRPCCSPKYGSPKLQRRVST
ncbi:unnamed protein product, partial [Boreogadus saida]